MTLNALAGAMLVVATVTLIAVGFWRSRVTSRGRERWDIRIALSLLVGTTVATAVALIAEANANEGCHGTANDAERVRVVLLMVFLGTTTISAPIASLSRVPRDHLAGTLAFRLAMTAVWVAIWGFFWFAAWRTTFGCLD